MSAETLRRAAALMRARAEAATPGRWVPFGTSVGAESDGCTCHGGIEPYGHEQYCGVEGPVVQASEPDVAHIAPLATPAVALAVADWLESVANRRERAYTPAYGAKDADWNHALAVARAYLGEVTA